MNKDREKILKERNKGDFNIGANIMGVDDILKIAASIVASLGGSAVIITAVAKWWGEFLAHKLLADIEYKHEKELEKYRTDLQNMSKNFHIMLEHSMQIASKQYDMEVEIYQNIWKNLYELYKCLDYINDFEHPTIANPEEYIKVLNLYSSDFKMKLEDFQSQMDSVAPFYQSNVYDLLCDINKEFVDLMNILDVSVSLEGMSNENKDKVNSKIMPQICEIKGKITNEIREYLFSLQKVSNSA